MPSLPMLLALVAVRATASQLFQPASRAAVPALVGDSDLETANSTLGFGSNAAEAVGPLLAAALFPLVGLRGVLLVDAVSFLVSAVLLATLPSLPPATGDGRQPSLLRQAKAGIGYLLSVPTVRVIFLGFTAVVAFNGVDDVALVLLAQKTFHVGESAVGLLLGAVGVGLVAGYAMLSRWGTRASMPLLLIAGFAVSSVGNLLTGLAWAVAAAIALQAVRGFGLAAMDVASSTLLQRTVPAGMRGRVFGNLYGAIGVAAATSYLAGGVLLDATSGPGDPGGRGRRRTGGHRPRRAATAAGDATRRRGWCDADTIRADHHSRDQIGPSVRSRACRCMSCQPSAWRTDPRSTPSTGKPAPVATRHDAALTVECSRPAGADRPA